MTKQKHGSWKVAEHGYGRRPWYAWKDDLNAPFSKRYLYDQRGRVKQFASQKAALAGIAKIEGMSSIASLYLKGA